MVEISNGTKFLASDVISLESMGNVRKKSRKNGWSWPPHPLQIASWLVAIYISAVALGCLGAAFDSVLVQALLYPVLTSLIIFVLGMTFTTTCIDPADDAVQSKLRNREQPQFDRGKHIHVIDNNFCNICEETVHVSSKHCRQCNKCVIDFDHHCKWLNNCVGAKNYKYFLIYVSSITITTAFISLCAIAVIVAYFVDENKQTLRTKNGDLLAFGTQMTVGSYFTLVISSLVLSIICCGLTLHLLGFHIKLIKNGLTTYNFIMDERQHRASKGHPDNPSARRRSGLFEGLKNRFSTTYQEDGLVNSAPNPDILPQVVVDENGRHKLSTNTMTSPAPEIPPNPNNNAISPARSDSSGDTVTPGAPKGPQIMTISSVSSGVRFEVKSPSAIPEVSNGSSIVALPPIADIKPRNQATKIFDPQFESVISNERELILPPILVKPPSHNSKTLTSPGRLSSDGSETASSLRYNSPRDVKF